MPANRTMLFVVLAAGVIGLAAFYLLRSASHRQTLKKIMARAATLVAGLMMKRLINWPLDYVLYPAMMLWLGNIMGSLVMIALSVPLNVCVIYAYDWAQTDWLLIETLKKFRDSSQKSGWRRHIASLMEKSDIIFFFVLCWDDPITVVLYFRHGSFNGMTGRDWKIFFAATVVANLYWIVLWTMVLEGVKSFF